MFSYLIGNKLVLDIFLNIDTQDTRFGQVDLQTRYEFKNLKSGKKIAELHRICGDKKKCDSQLSYPPPHKDPREAPSRPPY